ncbi:hypothetical protein M2105_006262 [Paenibacillus sp. PastF-1]|nr:hypothetical protein [Paenibacillus sp. PastF-2]MDF9851786.1 hypothetical protein [Paenibacillus sp. PastM-2]MDF9858346.1 hypothetical protein [Paenibacillus sp. PastF-1]MDH6483634.1 hypothetical protein [Paenibacillus sp. PastH-2]MDH6505074.1 hypothetical protein [Paenibacillus sp. PastM-3]
MFKALMSLFRRSDTKISQAVQKVQTPPTRVDEQGEQKINIQLD